MPKIQWISELERGWRSSFLDALPEFQGFIVLQFPHHNHHRFSLQLFICV